MSTEYWETHGYRVMPSNGVYKELNWIAQLIAVLSNPCLLLGSQSQYTDEECAEIVKQLKSHMEANYLLSCWSGLLEELKND